MDKFTCARRGSELHPRNHVDHADHWRSDGTCSYCGSIKPEVLLNGIEDGSLKITATDKNYKLYADGRGVKFATFYFHHFYDLLGNKLNHSHADRFIKAWRDGKIRWAGGFGLYVKPMFLA